MDLHYLCIALHICSLHIGVPVESLKMTQALKRISCFQHSFDECVPTTYIAIIEDNPYALKSSRN